MVGPYNQFADTSVYLGTVRLPHTTTITSSDAWQQTDLPIERGALIADHRRKQPASLSIEGLCTGQIALAVTTGLAAFPVVLPAVLRTQIYGLATAGATFLVKHKDRAWPNMSIISIDDDAPAGELRDDVWRFSLQLRETRIASSTLAPAGAVDPSLADLTAAPADGGPQSGQTVGPDVAGEVLGQLGGGV